MSRSGTNPKLTNNPHQTAALHVPFNWVCLANQQVCFSADSIAYAHAGCDCFQTAFHSSVKKRGKKKRPTFSRFHLLTHFSSRGSLKFQPTYTNPTHVPHIAGSTESKQKDPSNHTHAGHNVILHMRPGPHTPHPLPNPSSKST